MQISHPIKLNLIVNQMMNNKKVIMKCQIKNIEKIDSITIKKKNSNLIKTQLKKETLKALVVYFL